MSHRPRAPTDAERSRSFSPHVGDVTGTVHPGAGTATDGIAERQGGRHPRQHTVGGDEMVASLKAPFRHTTESNIRNECLSQDLLEEVVAKGAAPTATQLSSGPGSEKPNTRTPDFSERIS